ncbi:hypothetical protein F5I97DRAFT_1805018 [Phlebopus sp. FC_14]|nr:hypothetical protein F5I97DRAFT_1805018 [Phlebopus sp. FC_14]
MKVEGYSPPAPRRSTLASQRCQYRKLIAPFRSPLRLPVDNVTQMAKRDQKPDRESSTKSQEQHQTTPPTYLENKLTTTSTARTSKVAAQFKSPILASGVPPDSRCTLRLTPAIQKLERKLQLLKRAIKVKEDNEEEILNRLAKKWTDAGREVAYELWDLIKFAGTFPNNTPSFGNSWGWDTAAPSAENQDSRLSQTDLEAGFFKERLDYVEDDNGTLPTLGTMLRVHGIAAETLGWDDETETFRD